MSKRGSIFKQGKPGLEYEDLEDVPETPGETPKKATAAQMATRKIKAAKGSRRPAGATSGLSSTPSFGASQPGQSSGFAFGGTDSSATSNPFTFLSQSQQPPSQNGGMFGNNSNSSFPPAQPPATQSNAFTSSSFPSFGASQPSTFTFGGGSGNSDSTASPNLFNFSQAQEPASQPRQNGGIFGNNAANSFASTQPSTIQNTAAAAAAASPSFPAFGTSKPSGFAFSGGDTTANSNPFGFLSQSQQPPAEKQSTPAPFSLFGTSSAQETPATTQPTLFGTTTSATPLAPSLETPAKTPFNMFGTSTPSQGSAPTSQPGLFASVSAAPAATASETPAKAPFNFFGASTPAQESAASPQPSLFAPASVAPTTTSSTPASAPFSLFNSQPSASAPPSNPLGTTSTSTPTPAFTFPGTPSSSTPAAPISLFSAAQAKPPAASNPQPDTTNQSATSGGASGSLFKLPSEPIPSGSSVQAEVSTPSFKFGTAAAGQPNIESQGPPAAPERPSGLLFQTPAKAGSNGSLANPAKEQPPPSPASAMPNLTGAAEPPKSSETVETPDAPRAAEIPRVPKVRAQPDWSGSKDMSTDIIALCSELARMNSKYRTQLAQLPVIADWSSLSQWHQKETTDLVRRIAAAKKQLAIAKGITGNESSLSTKRKADDRVSQPELQDASPSKKPRGGDAPGTPEPKSTSLFSTTPKASPLPPATQTSSLFGNILSKGSGSTSDSSVAAKAPEKQDAEPSNKPSSQSSAGFPSLFKFGASNAASSKAETKPPSFGSAGSGSFLGQFASKSKTAEELKMERMEKDKAEDYDSDEETEEQWEKRWKEKEAEREAQATKKDQEKTAGTSSASKMFSGFSNSGSGTSTPGLFNSATPKATNEASSKLFSGFSNAASGTSTPGLFSSRLGSPAPSNGGGKSVFDTPAGGQTPSSNIFGHLSSGASSNNQDDDEDEEEEDEDQSESQAERSSGGAGLKKRGIAQSESESEESLEETMKRKKQEASSKPSLFSRITRDDPSETENNESEEDGDSGNATSILGKSNGIQTPSNKPFKFFDFGAAAGTNSAPPKQDTFGGDQTFKPGTPIKFGTSTKENPTFQFQPATPGPADFSATPSKPAPSNTFSFLNAGQSGPASITPSVLSSRAATPLSETEASGKETAADTEDEEAQKNDQVDRSALTEQELDEHDILFETEQALAKHQVEKSGEKTWENYARGPLWILKNKENGKALLRIRTSSGMVPLNYYLLPKLKTNVTGKSMKMVSAVGMKKDGKPGNFFICLKSTDLAEEFSKIYNANLP